MAKEYPSFAYSKHQVREAGKVIAGNLAWTDETEPVIRQAFLIANNWRDAHYYPMRGIRFSVHHLMRQRSLKGITAARLKRMQAIRGKLQRLPHYGLDRIQDLGGCRVILPDIASVRDLGNAVRSDIRHELRKEDNYIAEPKSDGYRSHHLMLNYQGRDDRTSVYNGRRIELQVRTRLQHAWSTTVEAIGLLRGEQLKNHHGSERWLRMFQLMSAEFAEQEKCPVASSVSNALQRREEIRALEDEIAAVSALESVGLGFSGPDWLYAPGYRPTHFLIRYDHATKTVHVDLHNLPVSATSSYDKAEDHGNTTGEPAQDIVLVEVDKIDNLKAAYPNYFGDVELFKAHLKGLVKGKSAVQFSRIPKQPSPTPLPPIEGGPGWLRTGFRSPDQVKRSQKPTPGKS